MCDHNPSPHTHTVVRGEMLVSCCFSAGKLNVWAWEALSPSLHPSSPSGFIEDTTTSQKSCQNSQSSSAVNRKSSLRLHVTSVSSHDSFYYLWNFYSLRYLLITEVNITSPTIGRVLDRIQPTADQTSVSRYGENFISSST